ncbi:hypothetical protein BS50DRAFT_148889 [Corynespora cassiicola Philippines]|uniref:Uncharacterized protein n=1 Tax=Corynespora cassiicola Philippines TaxID=1448308 RepID=A0A2T2N7G5_CORCC|nr:hypothetical protein BS50DRAFT_148889 [Corynespora cassiicola Philippines]
MSKRPWCSIRQAQHHLADALTLPVSTPARLDASTPRRLSLLRRVAAARRTLSPTARVGHACPPPATTSPTKTPASSPPTCRPPPPLPPPPPSRTSSMTARPPDRQHGRNALKKTKSCDLHLRPAITPPPGICSWLFLAIPDCSWPALRALRVPGC